MFLSSGHGFSPAAYTAERSRLQPLREFASREGSHDDAFFVVGLSITRAT
jgi:hypothetical protein